MANPYITLGSPTTGGGKIISGQSSFLIEGKAIACVGDKASCPKHKCVATIMAGDNHMLVMGKAAAQHNSPLSCGCKCIGDQNLTVGDNGGGLGLNISNFQPNSAQQNNNFRDDIVKKNAIVLKDIMIKPFIPLGVPKLDGSSSNDNLVFYGSTVNAIFEAIVLEIKKDETFIEVKRIDGAFLGTKEFKIHWDGFIQDVYDSKFMTGPNGISFRVKGINGGSAIALDEKTFEFKYFNKDWMDVLINRKSLKININLRVNLKDGGTFGLDSSWRRVPQSKINSLNPPRQPLTKRLLSFNQLKEIALEGMNYYWSRNNNHPIGKDILINEQAYQVTVKAIDTDSNHMPSIPIIFASNWSPGRSCNWELSRKIYYNCGYIEFQTFSGNPNDSTWEYWEKKLADNMFKHTLAHEMGHEILLAYGGHTYSKKHKGSFSSSISDQRYKISKNR